MLMEVEKVDPRKRIDVTLTKSVQYSKSESYLTELMADLCERFLLLFDSVTTLNVTIYFKANMKTRLQQSDKFLCKRRSLGKC